MLSVHTPGEAIRKAAEEVKRGHFPGKSRDSAAPKDIGVRAYPAVVIENAPLSDNTFECGNRVWVVANLIEKARDLPVFDLPLIGLNAGSSVWSPISSAYGLAKAMRRVLDVDLRYPIILDQDGFIMDGWNRVCKALVQGHATIKAVRFEKTPPHDYLKP